jgi:hypothetical protein
MQFARLTAEDQAALDSDREFAPAVLKARFAGTRLTGAPSDVETLQRILDGGPHSESPADELVALGTSLGDLLGQAIGMQWVRFTDEHGTDLGLRYAKSTIVIFPRDMIVKRVEDGEEVDLQHLYDGVVEKVQEMIASGEYQ